MASESKENQLLMLFLENSPLKQWHFEGLVREAKMTRAATNKWIKKYLKTGLIKHIKEKGKFPYYTVGKNNQVYQAKKRIIGLEMIEKSGLIGHLITLPKADTIIIFGSYAKGDWYKDSDIDLFIFGSAENIDKKKYEVLLKKEIELHLFKNKKEVRTVKTGLIKNIIDGYVIKGSIQNFIEVA